MQKKFSYTRRSFLITVFNLVVFIIIGVRLFFLQILKSKEFSTLSRKNSIKLIFLEPKRGELLTSDEHIIATNKNNYKLIMYKQREHDSQEILNSIFKLVNFSTKEKDDIRKKLLESGLVIPVTLKENLSWNEVAKVESNSHTLPGVFVEKGYKRFYPDNNLYSHITGYLGLATTQEIEKYNLFYAPDFKIGKTGIEKVKQLPLMGKFGMKRVEVNANRKIVRELSEIKSQTGKNFQLTLNNQLQQFVASKIGDKAGSVIVLDVRTGQILSMVSTPSFDPNLFATGVSTDAWNNILSKPSYPLTNKAIGKLYPPGSIWKIIVALAILESGIDPEATVECKGFVKIGNRKFKCNKHSGHGRVNLIRGLMTSCNPYFYVMSQQAGIKSIHKAATKFGFGNKSGIELPGELPGTNPNKIWKLNNFGEEWLIGDTANASIGQGYTLTTPLQIAVMISRLASGSAIMPSLITNHNSNFTQLSTNPTYLEIIRQGLTNAFNHPGGTGYRRRIKEFEYRMAAKTGTAQVVSYDTADPNGKHAKHHKSHSLFAGFAPVHDPKYAAAVVIDHGGWGSVAASPIGREILLYAQKNLTT